MTMSFEEIANLLTAPGQPFEIEHIEVDGVPLRNWKNAPPSLVGFVEASRQFGDRVARWMISLPCRSWSLLSC